MNWSSILKKKKNSGMETIWVNRSNKSSSICCSSSSFYDWMSSYKVKVLVQAYYINWLNRRLRLHNNKIRLERS